MDYYGYDREDRRFKGTYCCYDVSSIQKSHLESGDKIIMPVSALETLAMGALSINSPMMFELQNPSNGKVSHCGVLEFVADEGFVFMPEWMMKNIDLQKGELAVLKSAHLEKGTYIKLQPHTKDFIELTDPKAVLETTLRNFSCLTTGDTIMIIHNNKKYYIDIVETRPASAISVIETDCEVDFAPPLDYKEPEKPTSLVPPKPEKEPRKEQKTKFMPFTGRARRLDGLPASNLPYVPIAQPKSNAADGQTNNKVTQSEVGSGRKSGKVVFGSGSNYQQSVKESVKNSEHNDQEKRCLKKEGQNFVPFTGKKYTLGW